MDQKFLQFTLTDPEAKRKKQELLSEPVGQVDLERVETVADLMDAYADASIQARNLGGCCKVFESMLTDEERPVVFLGIAGPLIAAGLRKVIRDLIEFNLIDVVVSTGAILYQDYYQARGGQHYRGTVNSDDALLRDLLINRIYDTYVDEELFGRFDTDIGTFAGTLESRPYSSREFLDALAGTVEEDAQSILVTARRHGVPIFAPALNDSSIGIGLTEHYHKTIAQGKPGMRIDPLRDNYELTQLVASGRRTAAFYVAGGVPKNYINDSVVMSYIFGKNTGGHKYALQVTADAPHWGGLSGSTLQEAMSWGKVNRKANRAMAFVEPSVSLPFVVGYGMQKKLGDGRSRLRPVWKGDKLERWEELQPAAAHAS